MTNLKNNRKNYIPYLLTCVITVAMYYIMDAISRNPGLNVVPGSASVKVILNMGAGVVGIFSVIFLFYTNSFLVKQRKKEIGLYNVLGLGKRHIARMLVWEQAVVTLISLGGGLAFGILLSRLMFLILMKILHFEITMRFTVEPGSMIATLLLFGGIFLASLLYNLIQIRLANPVELLRGGNQGEKEPKTKIFMTILGFAALGGGYYIAQTTESPLAALGMFFVAVILVIIGTYALFTAGSIAMLKLLKKNKKFYYNTKHFISVSGMMYRMKQNAVGLANICILSTMVLVLVSTSVAMYVGMDDLLQTRFAHECTVYLYDVTGENKEKMDQMIRQTAEKHNMTITYESGYEYVPLPGVKTDKELRIMEKDEMPDMTSAAYASVMLMSEEEYNRLEGKTITLAENEAIVFSVKTKWKDYRLSLAGETYEVQPVTDMNVDKKMQNITDDYYIVLHSQEKIDALEAKYGRGVVGKTYQKSVDFKEVGEKQLPALKELEKTLKDSGIDLHSEIRELSRESFYSLYGIFLFLGIFLGSLFLMATVLIIYYKQISEGYDDKERFAIMQKVGLSRREVKQTVRSQVMTVFFLPLAMAVLHIAMAFKVITKLLAMMNLTNIPLFLTCTVVTVIVFAVFYVIVFAVTAREYYRIVEK